ncbi:MAG: prephenate dehydrogenase/arogenate dehydrogenase family protein, partial [Candidatus Peregrinibacteria bacterium]|nr:prephenate dehydrogenase/arogenate dehydrogenase family protein [Candidatus Peregrinibacteria bacterium]
MKIKKIGIIGGTHGIGQSFAKYFSKKFKDKITIYVSGRKTKITNKFIVQNCDLVIFSVPIFATEKVITEMSEFSKKGQIWTDFTSIKQIPINAMLKSKAQVCGLHPMFGPKKNITGDKIVFCPERISAKNLEQLKNIFEDFEIVTSNPTEHDKAMQIVQGISHFSDLVTGGAIKNSKISSSKLIKFSSPSYKLKFEVLGRMFAQNPDLYAQIIIENHQAVETYFRTLTELKTLIDKKDNKALSKEFSNIANFLGKEFCET